MHPRVVGVMTIFRCDLNNCGPKVVARSNYSICQNNASDITRTIDFEAVSLRDITTIETVGGCVFAIHAIVSERTCVYM